MPELAANDPKVLLARAARLKLYLALRRTLDSDKQKSMIGEHLTWMIGYEKSGQIFLSGPVSPHDGPTPLDGLSVIRAESPEAAATLINSDPFVTSGAVECELCEWTVNEGGIPIMLSLSDSTVTFR